MTCVDSEVGFGVNGVLGGWTVGVGRAATAGVAGTSAVALGTDGASVNTGNGVGAVRLSQAAKANQAAKTAQSRVKERFMACRPFGKLCFETVYSLDITGVRAGGLQLGNVGLRLSLAGKTWRVGPVLYVEDIPHCLAFSCFPG